VQGPAVGPPLATSRLVRERLRKLVALAVFSSDAISSTAYGTEQIMLVLVAAGAVATGLAFPIALGIGGLLIILILSYRQTIAAYPSAGGAYVVSKDNFGPHWALVAGSALLIDYILTVAVSVTSGVAALTTALPPLQPLVLPLSLAGSDTAGMVGRAPWAPGAAYSTCLRPSVRSQSRPGDPQTAGVVSPLMAGTGVRCVGLAGRTGAGGRGRRGCRSPRSSRR
jgi:amino acid transporter